jgi:hypothetical protein
MTLDPQEPEDSDEAEDEDYMWAHVTSVVGFFTSWLDGDMWWDDYNFPPPYVHRY